MIPLLYSYFKSRSTTTKVVIILVVVSAGFFIFISSQKAYYKYKYYQELEKRYITTKDSLVVLQKKVVSLTKVQKKKTNQAKQNVDNIHNKLQADEKAIDNRPVTDDELLHFLSRYD